MMQYLRDHWNLPVTFMRPLTILLPAVSVLVSAGVVVDQYGRRDRLKHELASAEQEFRTLQQQLPRGQALPEIHKD